MQQIRNRRAIVDRKALVVALDAMAQTTGEGDRRAKLVALLRDAHRAGREEVRRRHEEEGLGGRATAHANCYLMDQLLRVLFDFVTAHVYPLANPTSSERLALVATGGYGRGELAPFSDVDLLFLVPYKRTPWAESVAEYMLYVLWDLGLKVGHATRSPTDCVRLAKQDLTIRTALLEARYLWGDRALYDESSQAFWKEVVAGTGRQFVARKLAERDARHEKMGDSRYVVEPNLKEGKGGLRDLQTLIWIARYLYRVKDAGSLVDEGLLTGEEFHTFRKAEDFLWTVRCTLHYLAGRAEERLTFDVQPELSRRLRYTDHPGLSGVERFMKHYFLVAKQVGELTRVVCAVLEARQEKAPLLSLKRFARARQVKGFKREGDRLTLARADDFEREPARMLKMFAVAQETGCDIHPDALQAMARNLRRIDPKLRRDPQANEHFMAVLTAKNRPEVNLRRMNEAGVFGRFVPDFGRVVAQMQYDMYHHYTVDEHTIRAIGLLARIERGELAEEHPLSHKLIQKIVSRRALYVAVLLHDIAKGRGGDHSIIGAEIADQLCPRLGLTPAETDMVAWLVRYHLLMSHFAFKRDLADHKTILDFAETVQSPERLKLLIILTVVDIRAVGPGVWNGWKGQLLRELYDAAEEVLVAGHAAVGRSERVAAKKRALRERLSGWSEAALEVHESRFLDAYWIAEDLDTLEHNARLMAETQAAGEPLGVSAHVESFQDMTRVTVYTQDHPGLFARIAGALAVAGASITGAQIHTTHDGMALDNFVVQNLDDGPFADPDKLEGLKGIIRDTLAGKVRPRDRLRSRSGLRRRTEVFKVEPVVLIDNKASNWSTVVEVNARDRAGLLFDLTQALHKLKVSVFSAHVATYGERAVDVFYVKDLVGEKITSPARLKTIEARLLAAAEGGEGKPPAKPPAKTPVKSAGKPTSKRRAKGRSPRPAETVR